MQAHTHLLYTHIQEGHNGADARSGTHGHMHVYVVLSAACRLRAAETHLFPKTAKSLTFTDFCESRAALARPSGPFVSA